MPLSDVYLRKLKKGDKAKHHDEGGLYLFLSPAGGKLWRMDYTFEGKRKTLSVGKYPAVGLKEARARRDAAKTMIATGIDPSAEKKRVKVQAAIEEREQALTFEAVSPRVSVCPHAVRCGCGRILSVSLPKVGRRRP